MVNHNYFTQRDVERLEEQAVQIRQDIISMIHAAKAGHPRRLSLRGGDGDRPVLPRAEYRSPEPPLG